MTECDVIDGLHIRERTVDESEARQDVVRRWETRNPLAIPPTHIRVVIQRARTGELMCSCDRSPDCEEVKAIQKLLERGPRPSLGASRQGVA